MNKIKIIYIIGQLGKGGAEVQLYELVKGLNKERFDPMVVSLSEGGYWADKIRNDPRCQQPVAQNTLYYILKAAYKPYLSIYPNKTDDGFDT